MNTRAIRALSLLLCVSSSLSAEAQEPTPPASGAAQSKPVANAPSAAPTPTPTTVAPVVIEPRATSATTPAAPPLSARAPEGALRLSPRAPEGALRPPDVSALSAELSTVLDELIQARTRASVLAKGLFRTRIDINVLRRADDQQILRVKLALDGVPVHDSDGAALASEEAHLFTGYVAPGVHEISVEVSEQAKENATYRYTRAERFRIETRKNTSTQVDVLLRDDSDMAEELPEGDDGKYDVSTRVRVTPVKVDD